MKKLTFKDVKDVIKIHDSQAKKYLSRKNTL